MRPRMFIGSSAEGKDVALALQAATADVAEVTCWHQGVFEPGGYALDSLIEQAYRSDLAVLVATPDDMVESRGNGAEAAARDNVILEFGLFAGVLGRKRTYLLATGPMRLPSDTFGLTRLQFDAGRTDGNLHAAVGPAASQVVSRVRGLGARSRDGAAPQALVASAHALAEEVQHLCRNAVAQGWTVKTNTPTTLRLRPPGRGRPAHTLSKRGAEATRAELREFVRGLRAAGLRVNSALRRPPEESPL